jgi:hypothetical protein
LEKDKQEKEAGIAGEMGMGVGESYTLAEEITLMIRINRVMRG